LSVPPARASIWATGRWLLLASNGTDLTNDRCIVDLASIAAPTNVMDVGDTLTFEASLGPAEHLPADVVPAEARWSINDTLVARTSRPLDRPRPMRTSSCGAERWKR
jgi:hypothetical protein